MLQSHSLRLPSPVLRRNSCRGFQCGRIGAAEHVDAERSRIGHSSPSPHRHCQIRQRLAPHAKNRVGIDRAIPYVTVYSPNFWRLSTPPVRHVDARVNRNVRAIVHGYDMHDLHLRASHTAICGVMAARR